jgi:hypothetical protein
MIARLTAALLFAATAAPAGAVERGHNPGGTYDSLVFGFELALLGMLVVFAGLLAVFIFLTLLRRMMRTKKTAAAPVKTRPPEISAEVIHAIALALHLDLRTFDDDEAEELTIRKITRPFSPWMDSGKTEMIVRSQPFGKRR